MNKTDYLAQLRQHLGKLSADEVADILRDYEEHFDAGQRAGKTEDEIAGSLGSPRTVAQGYLVDNLVREADASPSLLKRSRLVWQIAVAILVLAPFNFLMFIGPFLLLLVLVITGWSISVTFGTVSVAGFVALAVSTTWASIGVYGGLSVFFTFMGMLGLTAFSVWGMVVVSKAFVALVMSYARWNIGFIKTQ